MNNAATPHPRLLSLDALRGFDMFWIIGGAALLGAIDQRIASPGLHAFADFFCEHVKWEGVHFHDLIFPLFLFIMGVSLPMVIRRRLEQGHTRGQIFLNILRRTAVLFLLGWVYTGLPIDHPWATFRLMGVLQRLALGYGFAAVIALFLPLRGQIIAAAACLVGYWLALRFIPFPGQVDEYWSLRGNLSFYLDRTLMGASHNYNEDSALGDPEGLFSTIPAIATCLCGVFAGRWLMTDQAPWRKVAGLAIGGAALLAIGYAWSLDFPLVKKIWTSSFALVAAGWSALLLALFYMVIDVLGWKKWSFFFIVIGMNSILVYLLYHLGGHSGELLWRISETLFGRLARLAPEWSNAIVIAGVLTLEWLLLWYLHRRKVYLRV